VLPPPAELPTEELLSLVFFHEADPLTVVERLPTAAAGPTRYEPVTARAVPARADGLHHRRLTPYRALMMGMGNLGPDGRRRQRLVAGIIVAAMVLAAGAVLLGSVL
jgi:hypothetical protein